MYIERVSNKNSPPAVLLRESYRKKNLVLAMIVARIINPKSKLARCRGFNHQTCSNSLGQLLNLENAKEDYPEERLVACRNPLIAEKNQKQREAILEAVEKELSQVEWHLRKILAPLLFEDEETEDITTDVIKAHRSESAKKKDRTKRNKLNLPIHSFRTLLEDLGTICLNKIKCDFASGSYVFSKITQPSSLQQSCLDLLEVSLICTQ